MGEMQITIETKLRDAFNPTYLLVENESHMHGGSALESHFKITIAADAFNGLRLLQRHRSINQLLSDELSNDIHALAMHTYTPEEWAKVGASPASPDCRGGSKHI
ncbi:MAG: BolA/IbaG family iron-sulfur metabolism protein [Idiomarina sp.]|nr:BolA/IbaG family iron-sulfur metabolism protein [Idiomarina sp.]